MKRKLLYFFTLFPLLGCSNDYKSNELNIHKNREATLDFSDKITLQSTSTVKQPTVATQNQENRVAKKEKILLNVPLIRQNPELKYGCEVTSLSMVLQYAGVKTNKMELYHAIKKDPDSLEKANGDIIRWGNPAEGFVGDMTGKHAGYAVFDEPIVELVNRYLPGRAVNLTNKSFDDILQHVSNGYPVVIWTTGDYRLPDRWEAWKHGKQTIKTPLDLHAVVLVGYDENNVYINDPLSGRKQVKVRKEQMITSWKALQMRAVSYK